MDPEYDFGNPDEAELFRQIEPGVPTDLARELAAEPAPVVGFNFELVRELSPLLGAVLITVAAVEVIKGLGLRAVLKRRFAYGEESRTVVYKWLTFVVALPVSQGWGFREVVLDTTSVSLSWAESLAYGGLVVATIARLVYEWRLSQIARDRLYKFLGVKAANAPDDGKHPGPTGNLIVVEPAQEDD